VTGQRSIPADAHRLDHRVVIAAPRGRVWKLVEDPAALMQWVHGMRSVTAADGRPGGFALGATFVQRIRIGLVPTPCRGEVTEFKPQSRLAVVVHHALFDLDIAYSFASVGQRTEVTCHAAVLGRALGTVLPRAKIERVADEILEDHLGALKALAERA
jgi:uncharacterized protein YndB with AHSA1/START domain